MLEFHFMAILLSLYILMGLFVFSSYQKHLLMTLLALEYVMLNIFFLLVMNTSKSESLIFFLLIFLVFAVSEGGVGLSVLVSVVRSHGSDMMKNYSVVW